jgi:hypothetical protein
VTPAIKLSPSTPDFLKAGQVAEILSMSERQVRQ